MDFAITGKKIKGNTTPLPAQVAASTKPTPKKSVPMKSTQPVVKPKSSLPAKNTKPQVKKQTKPEQKKVEKEVKVEVEEKKEVVQEKVEEKVQVIEQPIKEEPKQEVILGEVVIRYNHYKEKFPTKNGILSFVPIQQKYGFGDLFKGNFIPVVKPFRSMEKIQPETQGKAIQFTWKLENDKEYRLEIIEDDEQEAKYEKKAYIAPKEENKCPFKKNMRAEQLTAQMKKMSHDQYGSEAHKALLQQRDLEDVLFS